METSNEPVLYTVDEGVATITLNRPDTLNAMNDPLMSGISAALAKVKADSEVRVVVLTGAGRGFCSGADLAQRAQPDTSLNSRAENGGLPDGDADVDGIFNTAMRDLATCPVSTIARVNGAAAGGGFGLALGCDITIASSHAFFVATFGPRLGIVPDMGATWSIPMRVGRARALGITLLGERITAAQAMDWGLIWSAVEHDALDDEVARIAAVLKYSSPNTVTRIRSTIDTAARSTFSDQLNLEMEHQSVLVPRNMREGALAFMEKRDPQFGNERE